MNYDEASYFNGFHFAHIVAWLEAKRLARIHTQARRIIQENRYAPRS